MFELFSHVSAPNSPGRGMVWKTQTRFPVLTSNAMMSPLGYFCDLGSRPFSSDVGTMMMLPEDERRRRVHQVADRRVEVRVFLDFLRHVDDAVLAERQIA